MPPEVIITVPAVVAGLAATTSPTVWLRRWGWALAGAGLVLAVVSVGPAGLTGTGYPRCSSNPGSCSALTAATAGGTPPSDASLGAGPGGRGHPAGLGADAKGAWQTDDNCIDDGYGPMRVSMVPGDPGC